MQLTITKQDYKKFYIHNYFEDQNRLIRFMRKYMGPILLIIGVYLYASKYNFGIIPVGFCLGYGIFYTLKPFFFLLTNRVSDETFTYKFHDNTLQIKDRLRDGEIDLKENNIIENEKYFYIKLSNGQTIFFPKENIEEKMFDKFRQYNY